jgi:hypothetical protein
MCTHFPTTATAEVTVMSSSPIQIARTTLMLTLALCCVAAPSWANPPEIQHDDSEAARVIATPRLRLSAEQLALEAIREEGREQVRELAHQIKNTIDPQLRHALRVRAAEIKTETRLRFLRAKIEFARERGDLLTERQALAAIENIESPPKPVPSFHIRKAPGERSGS